MAKKTDERLHKLTMNIPWMTRYPIWRLGNILRRAVQSDTPRNIILVMANHFEPGWNAAHKPVEWNTQLQRVKTWNREARLTGKLIQDTDGTPFRHTYFFPGEQYHRSLLDDMAEIQSEGLGEVEIHLHHGIPDPDTPENLRRTLVEFRDILAEEHRMLARAEGHAMPLYSFVHGNFALANSIPDRCGVDTEMKILVETGCYADFTLPAAPGARQVPRINAVYQCGHPIDEPSCHRSGPSLRVGEEPAWPVIFTGPLVLDWERRQIGLPLPGIDGGEITTRLPATISRFHAWRKADISIQGRPEWVFVKLYCHGFIDGDLDATLGEPMRRFLGQTLEWADKTGNRIHFATAREAYNMAMAAVDGRTGSPGAYRNYRLRQIMDTTSSTAQPARSRASA